MNDRSAAPTPWPLTSSRYSPSRWSGSGMMPRPSPARSTQGWKAWATRRAPAVTSRRRQERLLHARRQPHVLLERLFRAAQRVLGRLAGGDVRLHADEVRHVARAVPDGRDRQPVPERAAVLAVVQDLDEARAGLGERRADLGRRGRVGARSLQEPAVPPHHVRDRVAGDPLEALVGVDQRLARLARVGDGESLGCDLERAVLQREPGGRVIRVGGRRRRVPGRSILG